MAVIDAGKVAPTPGDRPARLLAGVTAVFTLALGLLLGALHDPYQYLLLAGAAAFVCFLLTWQDELIGALAVATSIFIDFYKPITLPVLNIPVPAVATVVVGVVLLRRYLEQSPDRERTWIRTPHLWVWAMVLVLAALAIRTSESDSAAMQYYITALVSMPLAYLLGTQLGRGTDHLKRLLIALAVLACLISAHGIIQTQFGNFLFLTPQWNANLASQGYYIITGTDKMRAGSFFINPDKLGVFTAMMLPILLGLGVAFKEIWAKVAAFAGAGLVAVAMLFTYSTASFIAIAAGMLAAFLLIARGWARLYLPVIVVLLLLALAVVFPSSVRVLQAHATSSVEITERIGAWETGLTTIAHYPLTGIGLGYNNYWDRSGVYLSPLETVRVDDPQNSFFELAAMAGIPLALFYTLALGLCLAAAARNYLRARDEQRMLIGAVLVSLIVLTVNSLATPGWTYPALGLMGWLMLGAVASPGLLSAGQQASAPAEPALASSAIPEEGA